MREEVSPTEEGNRKVGGERSVRVCVWGGGGSHAVVVIQG